MSDFEVPRHGVGEASGALVDIHIDTAKVEPNWGSVIRSETLLHGQPVLHIEHNGALYQLRATRLGKLILTK
jgi:hemin uptake protein HemP